MAHTDNTQPRRLRPLRRYSREWISSAALQLLRREYNRQDRHNARTDLRRGEQPEPVQPRHRALWDAW